MDEIIWKMADQAPVPVWASREDKQWTFVNRPWLELTGRSFEEEEGDGWLQGVHQDDLDRCLAAYDWTFEERGTLRVEFRVQCWDGSFRQVIQWGLAHMDARGHFKGYVGFCLDVTERIEAEHILKKSKVFSNLVLGSLPAHVVLVAQDGRIVATNEAWTLFGKSNGADLNTIGPGANYRSVCSQAMAHRDRRAGIALAGLDSVLTDRRERFVHEYPCHAPGTRRWFDLLVHRSTRPVKGAILAHFDVTERHLAEIFIQSLAEGKQEKAVLALQGLIQQDRHSLKCSR
jgi:PAS domain S-box-containing protein